jgi:hypothetical protein
MNREPAVAFLDDGSDLWLGIRRNQLPFRLGRSYKNDLCVPGLRTSRAHCEILLDDGILQVRDLGGRNGTIVGNELIRGLSQAITGRTPLVLGHRLLWISPAGADGEPVVEISDDVACRTPSHGVCIIDICESSALPGEALHESTERIHWIIVRSRGELLLQKPLGDGFLVVSRTAGLCADIAQRVLAWQQSSSNAVRVDLRIALDVGATYPATAGDRIGVVIHRAARLEKTQRGDIAEPGKRVGALMSKNRCLISAPFRTILPSPEQRKCLYLGKTTLRGFGTALFRLYQYDVAQSQ